MSAFMDYDVACEAGRRGALRVIPMTLDVDMVDVVVRALADVPPRNELNWPKLPIGLRLRPARSGAEEGAWAILRACDAEADPRSIADWGPIAARSYTQLRDVFRRLNVPPDRAHDLARVFRALTKGRGLIAAVDHELIVGDLRTIEKLEARAGFANMRRDAVVSVEEFLSIQQFIPVVHPVVTALRVLLADLRPDF